ncbi:unnamed protein product [Dibothriocephalus latus]|uniref:Uncharacterized protein n=1 Tax=Dibothriocephalus latus TaxID=60516 RepID=A0A3P6RSW9_DIBLA|nr:unnamed protein product [Dibothriocephalus latus]
MATVQGLLFAENCKPNAVTEADMRWSRGVSVSNCAQFGLTINPNTACNDLGITVNGTQLKTVDSSEYLGRRLTQHQSRR